MNVVVLLGGLAAVYGIINLLLPHVPLASFVTAYLLQPALWGLLAWVVLRLPKYRESAKSREKSTILTLALVIGFLQVIIYFMGGLFSGFGKSPSSFSAVGIVSNLVYNGAMLLGIELSRAWLVNRMGGKHAALALAFVTIICTIVSLPLGQITGLKFQIGTATQVMSIWLPLLAENLLATELARLDGAKASLTYRAILAAFWWFSPILPDLSWALKGLIGIAVPIIGLAVVNGYHATEANRGKSKRQARKAAFPTAWVTVTIGSVALVWFAVGLFPLQPALVPSGSMIPAFYPGDIVIIAKAPAAQVRLGDIVEYRNLKENINIVHRVIEIQGNPGQADYFITKGDNNNAADADPVLPEQVIGKVVFRVPKVGYVSIAVKQLFKG